MLWTAALTLGLLCAAIAAVPALGLHEYVSAGAVVGSIEHVDSNPLSLSLPSPMAVFCDNSLLVADNDNHRIVQITRNATSTVVRTVAGTGLAPWSSGAIVVPGSPATKAELGKVLSMVVHPESCDVFISDANQGRIINLVPPTNGLWRTGYSHPYTPSTDTLCEQFRSGCTDYTSTVPDYYPMVVDTSDPDVTALIAWRGPRLVRVTVTESYGYVQGTAETVLIDADKWYADSMATFSSSRNMTDGDSSTFSVQGFHGFSMHFISTDRLLVLAPDGGLVRMITLNATHTGVVNITTVIGDPTNLDGVDPDFSGYDDQYKLLHTAVAMGAGAAARIPGAQFMEPLLSSNPATKHFLIAGVNTLNLTHGLTLGQAGRPFAGKPIVLSIGADGSGASVSLGLPAGADPTGTAVAGSVGLRVSGPEYGFDRVLGMAVSRGGEVWLANSDTEFIGPPSIATADTQGVASSAVCSPPDPSGFMRRLAEDAEQEAGAQDSPAAAGAGAAAARRLQPAYLQLLSAQSTSNGMYSTPGLNEALLSALPIEAALIDNTKWWIPDVQVGKAYTSTPHRAAPAVYTEFGLHGTGQPVNVHIDALNNLWSPSSKEFDVLPSVYNFSTNGTEPFLGFLQQPFATDRARAFTVNRTCPQRASLKFFSSQLDRKLGTGSGKAATPFVRAFQQFTAGGDLDAGMGMYPGPTAGSSGSSRPSNLVFWGPTPASGLHQGVPGVWHPTKASVDAAGPKGGAGFAMVGLDSDVNIPGSVGQVLVTGGWLGSAMDGAYEYNASTGTWGALPNLATPRAHHSMVVVRGSAWVVGGLDASGQPVMSVERWDRAARRWVVVPSAALNNGIVLGQTGGAMGRAHACAAVGTNAQGDEYLLLAGGLGYHCDADGTNCKLKETTTQKAVSLLLIGTLWEHNPGTSYAENLGIGNMPEGVSSPACSAGIDGRVYAWGGYTLGVLGNVSRVQLSPGGTPDLGGSGYDDPIMGGGGYAGPGGYGDYGYPMPGTDDPYASIYCLVEGSCADQSKPMWASSWDTPMYPQRVPTIAQRWIAAFDFDLKIWIAPVRQSGAASTAAASTDDYFSYSYQPPWGMDDPTLDDVYNSGGGTGMDDPTMALPTAFSAVASAALYTYTTLEDYGMPIPISPAGLGGNSYAPRISSARQDKTIVDAFSRYDPYQPSMQTLQQRGLDSWSLWTRVAVADGQLFALSEVAQPEERAPPLWEAQRTAQPILSTYRTPVGSIILSEKPKVPSNYTRAHEPVTFRFLLPGVHVASDFSGAAVINITLSNVPAPRRSSDPSNIVPCMPTAAGLAASYDDNYYMAPLDDMMSQVLPRSNVGQTPDFFDGFADEFTLEATAGSKPNEVQVVCYPPVGSGADHGLTVFLFTDQGTTLQGIFSSALSYEPSATWSVAPEQAVLDERAGLGETQKAGVNRTSLRFVLPAADIPCVYGLMRADTTGSAPGTGEPSVFARIMVDSVRVTVTDGSAAAGHTAINVISGAALGSHVRQHICKGCKQVYDIKRGPAMPYEMTDILPLGELQVEMYEANLTFARSYTQTLVLPQLVDTATLTVTVEFDGQRFASFQLPVARPELKRLRTSVAAGTGDGPVSVDARGGDQVLVFMTGANVMKPVASQVREVNADSPCQSQAVRTRQVSATLVRRPAGTLTYQYTPNMTAFNVFGTVGQVAADGEWYQAYTTRDVSVGVQQAYYMEGATQQVGCWPIATVRVPPGIGSTWSMQVQVNGLKSNWLGFGYDRPAIDAILGDESARQTQGGAVVTVIATNLPLVSRMRSLEAAGDFFVTIGGQRAYLAAQQATTEGRVQVVVPAGVGAGNRVVVHAADQTSVATTSGSDMFAYVQPRVLEVAPANVYSASTTATFTITGTNLGNVVADVKAVYLCPRDAVGNFIEKNCVSQAGKYAVQSVSYSTIVLTSFEAPATAGFYALRLQIGNQTGMSAWLGEHLYVHGKPVMSSLTPNRGSDTSNVQFNLANPGVFPADVSVELQAVDGSRLGQCSIDNVVYTSPDDHSNAAVRCVMALDPQHANVAQAYVVATTPQGSTASSTPSALYAFVRDGVVGSPPLQPKLTSVYRPLGSFTRATLTWRHYLVIDNPAPLKGFTVAYSTEKAALKKFPLDPSRVAFSSPDVSALEKDRTAIYASSGRRLANSTVIGYDYTFSLSGLLRQPQYFLVAARNDVETSYNATESEPVYENCTSFQYLDDVASAPVNRICNTCPSGAFCNGSTVSNIVPLAGYWQSPDDPLVFVQCKEATACRGYDANGELNSQSAVQAYSAAHSTTNCEEGYQGNLCHQCASGYARTDVAACSICRDRSLQVLSLLGGLVLALVMVGMLSFMTLRSQGKPGALHVQIAKSMATHVQQLSIAAAFNLGWPEPVLRMFDVFARASSVSDNVLSPDCLVSQAAVEEDFAGSKFFLRATVSLMLPFMLLALEAVFWLCHWACHCRPWWLAPDLGSIMKCCTLSRANRPSSPRLEQVASAPAEHVDNADKSDARLSSKHSDMEFEVGNPMRPGSPEYKMAEAHGSARRSWKTSSHKDWMLVTIIVTLFLLHPTLTKICLDLLTCQSIPGKDGTYLVADLQVQCNTGESAPYMYGIGVSFLLLYAIGIPLAAGYRLYQLRNHLHEAAVRSRYGFLYAGYKRSWYFFEVIIMGRKVMLAVMGVMLAPLGTYTQTLLALVTLIYAAVIHARARPYARSVMNRLEMLSLMTALMTLVFGLYLFAEDIASGMRQFVTALLVIMNGAYFVVVLYYLWLAVRGKIADEAMALHQQTMAGKLAASHSKLESHATAESKREEEGAELEAESDEAAGEEKEDEDYDEQEAGAGQREGKPAEAIESINARGKKMEKKVALGAAAAAGGVAAGIGLREMFD